MRVCVCVSLLRVAIWLSSCMTLLRRSHFKAIRPRVSDIEPRPKSFHRQYVNPFSIQRKARVCWIKPLQGIGRLRVLMSWAYMGWAWSCPAHVHQILPTPHLGCKLKCLHAAAVFQTPRRDLGLLPAFMAPSLQPRLFCLVGTEAPLTDPAAARTAPWQKNSCTLLCMGSRPSLGSVR